MPNICFTKDFISENEEHQISLSVDLTYYNNLPEIYAICNRAIENLGKAIFGLKFNTILNSAYKELSSTSSIYSNDYSFKVSLDEKFKNNNISGFLEFLKDDVLHLSYYDSVKHNKCISELLNIVNLSGILYRSYSVIPNGYNKAYYYVNSPWIVFKTYNGDLTIGNRKRVLEISTQNNFLNFLKIFQDEDVTKERNLIHAWTKDDAIHYLSMISGSFNDVLL